MKTLFIDAETTSFHADICGLIQISGIIEIDGVEKEKFDIRSNIFDDDEILNEALETNGISLSQIKKFPKPRIAFAKFISVLKKYVDQYDKNDKFVVYAYKSEFDNTVLRSWFLKNNDNYFGSWFWNPWIDIMNLSMYILQEERSLLKNFKLITVAEYLGLEIDNDKAHDSMYDIELAREVYRKIT